MPSLESLKKHLEEHGYREYPASAYESWMHLHCFQRVIRDEAVARPCLTNDKAFINIDYSRNTFPDTKEFEACEVYVTGEFLPGLWTKFMVYGLKPAELIARLEEIESHVLTAWNAVCAARR